MSSGNSFNMFYDKMYGSKKKRVKVYKTFTG